MQLAKSFTTVVISYFGQIIWTLALKIRVAVDFQAADGFLDPFLTRSFEIKSSNQADYTPNR